MNDFSPNERDEERLPSVLAELPRARPQRPSRRRAAARQAASAAVEQEPAPRRQAASKQRTAPKRSAASRQRATTKQDTASKRRATTKQDTASKRRATTKPKAAKTTARKPPSRKQASQQVEEPAPRQGYEAESELGGGTPVLPPSTSELVGSLAELAGELAQTGISAGGRLLKRALSRLSGP